jgi:DnaK suppressor protein
MRNRKQWLQRMRQLLLRRRDALLRSLSGELVQFNTSGERVVGDALDEAVDSDYGMVNSQLAEAESRELAAIDNALQRMGEKEYGACESCGHNIPLARLRALPYATTCIQCQRTTERENAKEARSVDWSRVEEPSDSSDNITFEDVELVS